MAGWTAGKPPPLSVPDPEPEGGTVRKYLIRREGRDSWPDSVLQPEVCHPTSLPWLPAPGGAGAFEVRGVRFEMIYEMFGIDVRALGDGLTRSEVEEVLDEVLARMEAHSGCKGYIVDLDAAGGRPVALP